MDTTIPMVGTLPLGLLDAWEENLKDEDTQANTSTPPSSIRSISSGSSTNFIASSARKKVASSASSLSSYFGYGKS